MADITPEDLVRYFAYQSHGHMATTRLHKLAYLSQLHSYDSLGKPVTDLTFIRYKHGPWSPDLSKVAEDFEAGDRDVLVESMPSERGVDRRFRPAKPETTVSWSDDGRRMIQDVWAKLGYVPTEVIIAICKSARLFLATKLGERINFSGYVAQRAKALSSLEDAAEGARVELPVWGFVWEVTKERSGFSAETPDLAGCITEGDTRDELEANMLEAVLAILEDRVMAVSVPA